MTSKEANKVEFIKIAPLDQNCIVCNAKATEHPGRKFYPFLPLPKETQEPQSSNNVPAEVQPSATSYKYICSLHFQPKEESTTPQLQCFVCGASRAEFPDREFLPFNVQSKNLTLNGVPVKITSSASSTYICSVHLKTNEDNPPSIGKISISNPRSLRRQSSRITQCCIPSCQISRTTEKVYMFPNSKEMQQKWKNAFHLAKIHKKINGICRRHFIERFITADNGLTRNAVPTLYLESATEKYGVSATTDLQESDVVDLDSDSEPDLIEIKDEEQEDTMTMETELTEEEVDVNDREGTKSPGPRTPTPMQEESLPVDETPIVLDSLEKILNHMQPLFDVALLNENYEAVVLLNKLEYLFKKEMK